MRNKLLSSFNNKIKFIPQVAESECGPVALYSILHSYGVDDVSIKDITREARTGRNGTSLKGLVRAAEYFGVNTQLIRVNTGASKASIEQFLPAIVRINQGHFVVIEKISWNGKFHIIDPSRGRYSESQEELGNKIDPVWLSVDLSAAISNNKKFGVDKFFRDIKDIPTLKWILQKGNGLRIYTTALCWAISLSSLLFIGFLFRQGLTENKIFLMYALIISIISACILWIALRSESKIIVNYSKNAVIDIAQRIFYLPIDFFDRRFSAELSFRPQSVDNSFMSVAEGTTRFIASIICFFAAILSLFILYPETALVACVATLIISFIYMILKFADSKVQESASTLEMQVSSDLRSSILSAEELKSAISVQTIVKWLNTGNSLIESSKKRSGYLNALVWRIESFIDTLVVVLAVVASPGINDVVISLLLVGALNQARSGIVRYIADSSTNLRVQNRAYDDIQEQNTIKVNSLNDIKKEGVKYIKFKVFKESSSVDFMINSGGVTHVVGRSGIGKTKIVHRLLGLDDTTFEDNLFIDGVIPRNFSRIYVPDRPLLIEGSVRENLMLDCLESRLPDSVLWEVLESSCADEFVRKRGGLEAPVLFEGKNYSGGERQRLAIARVLLKAPDIVVLDEALSATGKRIQHTLLDKLRTTGCMIINITHEKPEVQGLDTIVDLDVL